MPGGALLSWRNVFLFLLKVRLQLLIGGNFGLTNGRCDVELKDPRTATINLANLGYISSTMVFLRRTQRKYALHRYA